jgi:hypothetical protein
MDGETQMHFCEKCFGTRPGRAFEDPRPERFEAVRRNRSDRPQGVVRGAEHRRMHLRLACDGGLVYRFAGIWTTLSADYYERERVEPWT